MRLDTFDARKGLDRGRSGPVVAAWYLCKCFFFLTPLPWPVAFKRALLRFFGASIGSGVVIKPGVNILFPWKLSIEEHAWIGEESWLLNFEPIEIGPHACVSQRAFLCGGNHDFHARDFAYRNGPIRVERGAWVGASAFVAPGTTIGEYAVITAGSVVVRDFPAGKIGSGNPCQPTGVRYKDSTSE